MTHLSLGVDTSQFVLGWNRTTSVITVCYLLYERYIPPEAMATSLEFLRYARRRPKADVRLR
jgi:hypothetical protein